MFKLPILYLKFPDVYVCDTFVWFPISDEELLQDTEDTHLTPQDEDSFGGPRTDSLYYGSMVVTMKHIVLKSRQLKYQMFLATVLFHVS